MADMNEIEKHTSYNKQKLNDMYDGLKNINYAISHILKAPLRGINGFTKILHDNYYKLLDEEGKILIKNILNNTTKMDKLINNIFILISMLKWNMNVKDINISNLVKNIASKLKDKYPERKIEIILPENIKARADKYLIELALQELMDNSFKFTSSKKVSKIEFGIIETDDTKTFFIKDNGIGFNMKYKDKLFNICQKIHNFSENDGDGMGLYIVYQAIKMHKGLIWAESEKDNGTVFYFTINSKNIQ